MAAYLSTELRRRTVVYHAGLTREERNEAQEQFMGGTADVVVATNAFGMGVDKANIRSVVHFNLTGTIEAYYQEAGRAGRDDQYAQCLLLYAPSDRKLQEHFIDNEYPSRNAVYAIYEHLRALTDDPIQRTRAEIRDGLGLDLSEMGVGAGIRILESAGPWSSSALARTWRSRESTTIPEVRPWPIVSVARLTFSALS